MTTTNFVGKYELTISEIVEKFQQNLKSKALREFYFQGENYKKGCVGYLNDSGFFELRTFSNEKGLVREIMAHRVGLSLSAKNFNQKYRVVESLHEIF